MKLDAWELPRPEIERVLAQLGKEDFLNEARFAEAFAIGHFRQKGWGRSMIRHALLSKAIPERLVTAALETIDDEEYGETLKAMVVKRLRMEKERDPFIREQRVIRYLLGRGWDTEAVRRAIAAMPKR